MARKHDSTAYNYLEYENGNNYNRRKRLRKKKNKAVKAKIISAILLFFFISFCFIAGTAVQAIKGNTINQLEKEIEQLKITNERLLLKKTRLQSLDRIEQIAIEELGMQRPEIENVKILPTESGEEIRQAIQTESNERKLENESKEKTVAWSSKLQPYVAAISSLISNWLITE